eukprot:Opistho-2@20239
MHWKSLVRWVPEAAVPGQLVHLASIQRHWIATAGHAGCMGEPHLLCLLRATTQIRVESQLELMDPPNALPSVPLDGLRVVVGSAALTVVVVVVVVAAVVEIESLRDRS